MKLLAVIVAILIAFSFAEVIRRAVQSRVLPPGAQVATLGVHEAFCAYVWFTIALCACAALAAIVVIYCRVPTTGVRIVIVGLSMLLGAALAGYIKAAQYRAEISLMQLQGLSAEVSMGGMTLHTIPWCAFATGLAATVTLYLLHSDKNGPDAHDGPPRV